MSGRKKPLARWGSLQRSSSGQPPDLDLSAPQSKLKGVKTGRDATRDAARHAAQNSPRGSPWGSRQSNGHEGTLLEQLAQRSDSFELSQTLTSVINAPNAGSSSAASGPLASLWCLPFGTSSELSLQPPPSDPTILPRVSLDQFQPYLEACSARQAKFEADQEARAKERKLQEAKKEFSPGDGLVEAMKHVPAKFFESDFSLARPETWREVLSTEEEDPRLARLEGYTTYVDIVESQILREVAALQAHSTQFYEASTLLQELRGSLHRAYTQVTGLRQDLGGQKASMQHAAETVNTSKQSKANLEAVMAKLQVAEEVVSAKQTVELLLPQGDFAGALDVLDSLQAVSSSHRTAGMQAFHHLKEQLAVITETIDSLLTSEFLRASQNQGQHAAVAATIAQLLDAKSGALGVNLGFHANQDDSTTGNGLEGESASLEDELTPFVLGLQRTGKIVGSIEGMQVSAAASVKAAIRDTVEQALLQLSSTSGRKDGISDQLEMLDPEDFLLVLGCVTQICLDGMRHVRRVQEVVKKLLKASKTGRSFVPALEPQFQEVIQAVSEAAHSRWIKLLASRSHVVNSLDMKGLKALLQASSQFEKAMQAAGGRPVPALRNATQSQSRAYLEWMHRDALARVTKALEVETWVVQPVHSLHQSIVQRLLSKAGPTQQHAEASANKEGKLYIGNQAYSIVGSEMLLLEMLDQGLDFIETVPSLAVEAAHRIVELIKVFNSRTCQLVLGAGAMQVAGLKSITAKHLAISCQCVSFLIQLHPALAASLAACLPATRRALLAPELNLILKDLSTHKAEIHSKLVGIMRERLIASLKQLPSIASQWTSLPAAKPAPSPFAQSLAKQLRTLSQVLTATLIEEEVYLIFGRIGALYSKNLAEAFTRLEPLGPAWELQCRADLGFLLAALQDLPTPPESQASIVERLANLLETRFAPLQDSSLPVTGHQYSNGSLSNKSGLVARLGNTKIPFFRSKGDSPAQEALPDSSPAEPGTSHSSGPQAEPDRLADVHGEVSSSETKDMPGNHSAQILGKPAEVTSRQDPSDANASGSDSPTLRHSQAVSATAQNGTGLHAEPQSGTQSTAHSRRGSDLDMHRFEGDDRLTLATQEAESPLQHSQRPPLHPRTTMEEPESLIEPGRPNRRETAESLLAKMESAVLDRHFGVDSRAESFSSWGESASALDQSGTEAKPDGQSTREQMQDTQHAELEDQSELREGEASRHPASEELQQEDNGSEVLQGGLTSTAHQADTSASGSVDGAAELHMVQIDENKVAQAASPEPQPDEPRQMERMASPADKPPERRQQSDKAALISEMLKTVQDEDWTS